MTERCFFCSMQLTKREEDSSNRLFNKYICNRQDCLAKANTEMHQAVEKTDTIENKLRRYLNSKGFTETRTKLWIKGLPPNQRFVDLSKRHIIDSMPDIGIIDGTQRILEGHGISEINDIKQEIESIINVKHDVNHNIIQNVKKDDIKKPSGNENHISYSLQEEIGFSPPIEAPTLPVPDGESHPELLYVCYTCQAGITAEQRSVSFKRHQRAFCKACEGKREPKPAPVEQLKAEPLDENKEKQEKKKPMVTDETKTDIPVVQKKAQLPALSDHQIDEMIERTKARKFLEGQGGSYKVSGKERPDSAMIQKISNEAGISTEILVAEQTDHYAHVVVRGHLDNRYVDAVVHHDFDTEFQLKTMEIIEKNPLILDHYEGLTPVLKEGAKIIKRTDRGEEQIDAKYYLIHALLSFKKFSLRDGCTKACAIVQSKLLNRDARDPEEVKSEQFERDLVENSKKATV